MEKAPPPSVHLLHATNNILRPHCVKFFGSDENLLLCLKEQVGVVPQIYQGKEGAFEGPQCVNILNELEVLAPYLVEEQEHGDGILLYSVLELFKRVKDAVFSLELADNHEEVLEDFKTHLHMDYTHSSLPITLSST